MIVILSCQDVWGRYGKIKLSKTMALDILVELRIFEKFLQRCTALAAFLPSVVYRLRDVQCPGQI